MEKQIKSRKRVQDFAEVYTAKREVKAMCDLIPQEQWDNIDTTFLEPACGNGAFLVEIFERKLSRCNTYQDGLRALKSITGIDIQAESLSCHHGRRLLREAFLEGRNGVRTGKIRHIEVMRQAHHLGLQGSG